MLATPPRFLGFAALTLGLLAASCTQYELQTRDTAPPGALGALPPNTGRICVLRPHSVAGLVPAVVRDNGRLVGMTKGPTYFCYFVEPGFHSIVTRYGDDVDAELGSDDLVEATMIVDPGGRYFLHHDVTKILTLSVNWEDPAAANEMLGECDYVDLVAVPSGEALPAPGEVIRAMNAPRRSPQ
jgi:hypothetical protein